MMNGDLMKRGRVSITENSSQKITIPRLSVTEPAGGEKLILKEENQYQSQ